jgi:lysophospholipase L1-like esterase
MAYQDGQLIDFVRRIEKVRRRSGTIQAILISGGGNDVAGTQFEMLLNHAASPTAGLNLRMVEGLMEDRLKPAYLTILTAITKACEAAVGHRVPILVHGYDHPVPDGRGFLGGWGPLPGPWFGPGFNQKGFDDLAARVKMVRSLIDRFNAIVAAVAGKAPFQHVHYVDLRGTLTTGPNYKRWWANELHPTEEGFERLAARFAAAIAQT